MSDYVDRIEQDALFDEELDQVDWGQLQEEVISEPWLQHLEFNWSAWDQGADAEASVQPGDG